MILIVKTYDKRKLNVRNLLVFHVFVVILTCIVHKSSVCSHCYFHWQTLCVCLLATSTEKAFEYFTCTYTGVTAATQPTTSASQAATLWQIISYFGENSQTVNPSLFTYFLDFLASLRSHQVHVVDYTAQPLTACISVAMAFSCFFLVFSLVWGIEWEVIKNSWKTSFWICWQPKPSQNDTNENKKVLEESRGLEVYVLE